MKPEADAHALNLMFNEGRTYNAWQDTDVPAELIRRVYDLTKMGPTSANCCPARFVFLHSDDGKNRLAPLMAEGNREKTMAAPWVVIIANDMQFHEKIPQLFPHNPGAKDWFEDMDARRETAMRNGTLQGAYLMLAARALGLDCGPMSGFDMDGVNAEFFENAEGEMKHWRANWVCAIGVGANENLFPRSPRLDFDEACRVL